MIRDLPKGLRSGKKFKDDRHILGWLIERLQDPGRKDLYFNRLSAHQDALLETATGIFRSELSYAKGIYVLSGREDADSAIPIVRSLLELWADFKYLLKPEEPDRVSRVRIWGALVILHRLKPGQPPNPDVQSAVHSMRRSEPALFASVEKQYEKNPMGHYSGKGRKRLITEVCGDDSGHLYEFLSWEVHPITQGLIDVTTHRAEGGARVRRFVYRQEREKLARFVCAPAINVLSDSWSVFVKTFGSHGRPRTRRKKA